MIDAIERKKRAIKARAASSTFPGEVAACAAALERLEAGVEGTRNVVRAKAAASGLLPHQRTAWLCLVSGAGKLSRKESSFLHNMRERRFITGPQEQWLALLDARISWEASR